MFGWLVAGYILGNAVSLEDKPVNRDQGVVLPEGRSGIVLPKGESGIVRTEGSTSDYDDDYADW